MPIQLTSLSIGPSVKGLISFHYSSISLLTGSPGECFGIWKFYILAWWCVIWWITYITHLAGLLCIKKTIRIWTSFPSSQTFSTRVFLSCFTGHFQLRWLDLSFLFHAIYKFTYFQNSKLTVPGASVFWFFCLTLYSLIYYMNSGDQDSKIPLTQTRIIANNLAKDLKLVPFTKYGPWYDKKQVFDLRRFSIHAENYKWFFWLHIFNHP